MVILSTVTFFVLVVVFSVVFSRREEAALQFFEDSELQRQVGSFNKPGIFQDFGYGWNNKTLWVKNNHDSPVELAFFVTALPEGWLATWDYDGEPIRPGKVEKVTVSIYTAYPVPPNMIGLNFKYKVADS